MSKTCDRHMWRLFLCTYMQIYYGGTPLAKKKKVNDYGTGIPQHEMEALVRVLLPEIEKFYASEEGQRQFAQWKEEQQLKQHMAKAG